MDFIQLFHMLRRRLLWMVVCLLVLSGSTALAQSPRAVLETAVMCGGIENFKPVDPAVVFSISQGEVFCFTNFDPVPEKSEIFHKWYKRDKLIFTMKLTLTPPKWSSFSRVQIRTADKGPWRVEVRRKDGVLLKTLRFSMVD